MTEFTHLTKQQFGQKHMACVNHQTFKLFRFISSKVNTFMQNPTKTKVWKQQTVPTFVVTMFKNWPKIGCPIIYIFDITGGTYFRARSSKFVEPWSEVSPTKGSALLVWINFFCFPFLSWLRFSSWHWGFTAYLFMSDLALGGVTRAELS